MTENIIQLALKKMMVLVGGFYGLQELKSLRVAKVKLNPGPRMMSLSFSLHIITETLKKIEVCFFLM